jgi:hypothetical protein
MRATTQQVGNWKRILLVLLIVLNATLLSACDDSDWEFFWNLGLDWATGEGIVNGDHVDVAKVGEKMASDTVDSLLWGPKETALDAHTVVDDINRADKAAQDAVNEGNVEREERNSNPEIQTFIKNDFDLAMRLRPKDWKYTEMHGAYLLGQGDLNAFKQSDQDSKALVLEAIKHGADCDRTWINFYRTRLTAMQQQYNTHPENQYLIDQIQYAQNYLSIAGNESGGPAVPECIGY